MDEAAVLERVAARFRRTEDPLRSPGQIARALWPATVQTPAMDLLDTAINEALDVPESRTIITMPPQEGKSTRVTICGALAALRRNKDCRVAIASYGQDLANEFGRTIRNSIQDYAGQDGTLDLGLRIAPDNGAVAAWKLTGHAGGVRSVGIASGLTGRPADVLFIDDPIANMEQAESIKYRERVWNFWLAVGSTRLAPGAPVIVILTRWHHDDLVGRLLSAEDGDRWKVINIPAEAEEDDPLGREPGEFLESTRGRTVEQWKAIKARSGPWIWGALYQGNPTPRKGGIFCDEWPEFEYPMWIERPDGSRVIHGLKWPDQEMAQSWDLSFKDMKTSSWTVGQVWLRVGPDVYLLHQVRARMNFSQALDAIVETTALWPQSVQKFIEDKANGPAIINSLRKKKIGGIIPIEPEGSKYARAQAISPFTHAGNVILPAPLTGDGKPFAPWISDFKKEMRDFPNGENDDQVDTMSQAINRLLLVPMLEDDMIQAEEFDEYDARGWAISPV